MAAVLTILLTVLKVLGIILLCILGLILLLLLVVLFVPLRTKGHANINGNEIDARVKASFLLNINRLLADYKDNKLLVRAKIFFFTVMKEEIDFKAPKPAVENKGETVANPADELDSAESKDSAAEVTSESASVSDSETASETAFDEKSETSSDSSEESESEVSADSEEPGKVTEDDDLSEADEAAFDTESDAENKALGLFDKISDKFDALSDKIDELERMKDTAEEFFYLPATQKVLRIGKKQLLKTLKGLRHFYISGDVTAGFDKPELTGYVYGGYNVVSTVMPNWKITYTPDFEESRMEGQLQFGGRINVWNFVRPALRLAVCPALWKTIKTAKKLMKKESK